MGITKNQLNNVLGTIFAVGNKIELLSTVSETGAVKISGTGYAPYTIQSGDFNISDGVVTSAKNMMFYLCESQEGHGTAKGFGVYSGSTLLYFGEFREEMPIVYNSVPTIKKYNGSDEGISITLTSTETVV